MSRELIAGSIVGGYVGRCSGTSPANLNITEGTCDWALSVADTILARANATTSANKQADQDWLVMIPGFDVAQTVSIESVATTHVELRIGITPAFKLPWGLVEFIELL